jgi:hypothetical protein
LRVDKQRQQLRRTDSPRNDLRQSGVICEQLPPLTALNTALEPFLVSTGPEDTRSAIQRRADGLYDIARLLLDHEKLGDLGGSPPRLQVACDLPTLVATNGAPDAEFP